MADDAPTPGQAAYIRAAVAADQLLQAGYPLVGFEATADGAHAHFTFLLQGDDYAERLIVKRPGDQLEAKAIADEFKARM